MITRIGIIGTENSHADHYVETFNHAGAYEGYRVVALAGGHTERNQHLAELGGIEHVLEEPTDLLGLVDSVIVCSRDGRRHYEQALPFLEAGLPVFLDKPLTCDVEQAEHLIALAHEKGVLISSYSILRWAPEVAELANRLQAADPSALLVRGPASPSSEYAGLWFYGIHVVEIATALLGDRTITDVTTSSTGQSVFGHGRADHLDLLLEFFKPVAGVPAVWTVAAATPDGVIAELIPSSKTASDTSLGQYVRMLQTGQAPLSDSALLASVSLMQAIVQ